MTNTEFVCQQPEPCPLVGGLDCRCAVPMTSDQNQSQPQTAPDDVTNLPLDERARKALLEADDHIQAWLDLLAEDPNPKRRKRMMKLATHSRRCTNQAMDDLEQTRRLVKTGA